MPAQQIVQTYLNELRQIANAPNATEHSYRPSIATLVRDIADQLNRPLSQLILEPGNVTAAGAPDVVVYGTTTQDLIGYIETKDLGKDLDNLRGHDLQQFNRYRAAFPVWIYTNYLDFRLYEDGQLTHQVTLCHKQQVASTANLNQIAANKATELETLLDRFLQLSTPQIAEARSLARLLAYKSRLLEQALLQLLNTTPPDATLLSQVEAYRRWLIPDLTTTQFADYYAQTLTYGLFFAAFANSRRIPPLPFNRTNLLALLPTTVRPVRAIFQLLAAQFLPDELNWILDDLIRLLERADMGSIAQQLGQSRDPVVHFYETFLSEYDPALREMRGVYYTPDEVVRYIVRSIDALLRRYFNKADGLASADVTLLDPALGTGTFMAHALQQVADDFGPAHAGNVPDHLRQHTLRKWYGFELLAAPYVLAYLKLGEVLRSLNVSDAIPQIYLTNTLGEHQFPPTLPGPFEQAISEDGRAAQRVKGQEKILVLLGNPPYAGTSYNVYDKIRDYRVPGERARNWLQNDYIKFIRWAEWKITEAQEAGYQHGIIGFITDHSYLNGPLFAGMRKHLLENFSRIYIYNLHGNSRVREIPPANISKDQNVFDIQQGVAITLLVRTADHQGVAEVYYADLWGDQPTKYNVLSTNDVITTEWIQLEPVAPRYFFIHRTLPVMADEYRKSSSVTQLFILQSMGIVSARDRFAYTLTKPEIETRITTFADVQNYSNETFIEQFGLRDTSSWSLVAARLHLANNGIEQNRFVQCAYRPFDIRWTYYSTDVLERPLERVIGHLLQENFALVTFRHTRRLTSNRAFGARHVVDARLLSSESNCYVFPLYRYTDQRESSGQLALDTSGGIGRESNLHPALLSKLTAAYGNTVTPEDVFYYIYGILNAPGFLQEFEILLHEDFPRIPFTTNYTLFAEMVAKGERLIKLHLLEATDLQGLSNLTVGFPVNGNNEVASGYPQYNPTEERVYINLGQYFSNITPSMWEHEVGGYTPLEKWLKDRRGHTLSANERRHYESFATAIGKVLNELPDIENSWQAIHNGMWFNPLAQLTG